MCCVLHMPYLLPGLYGCAAMVGDSWRWAAVARQQSIYKRNNKKRGNDVALMTLLENSPVLCAYGLIQCVHPILCPSSFLFIDVPPHLAANTSCDAHIRAVTAHTACTVARQAHIAALCCFDLKNDWMHGHVRLCWWVGAGPGPCSSGCTEMMAVPSPSEASAGNEDAKDDAAAAASTAAAATSTSTSSAAPAHAGRAAEASPGAAGAVAAPASTLASTAPRHDSATSQPPPDLSADRPWHSRPT